ncbi:kinase-like protein [Peniophora sp. CONT]|nr:kinase-like protein [Peniophora sp. CONT]
MDVLSSPQLETQALTQAPEEDWAEAPDADTVASLIPATPNGPLRRIDFMKDAPSVARIGRAPGPGGIEFPQCAVMSAYHCKIEWQVGPRNLISFTIQDKSMNGTSINGTRRTKGETGCLSHRDVVRLGTQDYTFHFYQYHGLVPQCAIHDDYDLKQTELGRGTFAVVRHAIHRKTGREVAVKVIDCAHDLRSKHEKDRLFREIDIMRTVRHPNIMEMSEDYLDETGGSLYLVLEMMRGGNLLQYIQANWQPDNSYNLDELIARSFATQLVDALDYLHSRRIVHRDLKPQNIMLSGDHRVVKVADFGVSKIDNTASGVHTLKGTVEYIAPEMLSGRYNDLVDSYSLGLVIYNLLTGVDAFIFDKTKRQPTDIHSIIRERKVNWPHLEENEYLSHESVHFVRRLVVTKPNLRMSMSEAKEHPWILSERYFDDAPTDSESLDNTQADMSLDGPSFSIPSASASGASFLSDASGPAPTPPEPTPRKPAAKAKARGASTSPKTRMIRGRNSNADISMASARSEPPVVRKGKRRAQSVAEDEPDVLPTVGQKKRKVAGHGSQEDVDSASVADGRRSKGAAKASASGERSLQRRRSARLSKE